MRTKASVRVIAATVGLLAGIGVVTAIVNRIRQEAGIAVAGVSFAAVLVVYVVGALLLASCCPDRRRTPACCCPAPRSSASRITGLQAVSQLYLPDRFSRASELYGAIGATVVTLGWFFIAGRAMVLANALNAAVFERFGSITSFVFGLPLLRALPARWAWLRRRFDLPEPSSSRDRSEGHRVAGGLDGGGDRGRVDGVAVVVDRHPLGGEVDGWRARRPRPPGSLRCSACTTGSGRSGR